MSKKLVCVVTNPVGLYATPATELVNTVKPFHCVVSLEYANKSVNLKSMMGVLSLGIPTNAKLTIVADGEDENQAIREIEEKMKELKIID